MYGDDEMSTQKSVDAELVSAIDEDQLKQLRKRDNLEYLFFMDIWTMYSSLHFDRTNLK